MKKIRAFLLLACFTICSCTITKALWRDGSYKENFQQFFIGSDGRQVVFIGKNYHYIFDDGFGIIKDLLGSRSRDLLFISAEKTVLRANLDNSIEGNVTISTFDNAALSRVEFQNLKALGFRNNQSGSLSLTIDLKGVRYASNPEVVYQAPELNRRYIVSVYEETSSFGKVSKAAITPITMTADAILTIGKIILIPLKSN